MYAAEQASIQRGFLGNFQRLWQAPIKNIATQTGPLDEGRELDGDLNGGVLCYNQYDSSFSLYY